MRKTKIYFVAGASGSGKSAILNDLKKLLGDSFQVFDFDDIGVPQNADTRWRQQATEQWLQKLLKEKKDVVLLGQMVLGEIVACPSAQQLNAINFCLLDVADAQRVKRLKKRDTYGVNQHTLNWTSWLRMHHQDPQWEQHVIKDNSWEQLNFAQWDKLTQWEPRAHVTIIDTTDLTISQTAKTVNEWMSQSF